MAYHNVFQILFLWHVYMPEGVCMVVREFMWRPKVNLHKSVLSFHHVSTRIEPRFSSLVALALSFNPFLLPNNSLFYDYIYSPAEWHWINSTSDYYKYCCYERSCANIYAVLYSSLGFTPGNGTAKWLASSLELSAFIKQLHNFPAASLPPHRQSSSPVPSWSGVALLTITFYICILNCKEKILSRSD